MTERTDKGYRDLARRATEAKAEEAQRARDLDEVVAGLKRKVTEAELQRDNVTETAKKVIDAMDGQLARIKDQCRIWKRGELDTMSALAGICSEVEGHPLPEPGAWERAKAVDAAKKLTQLRQLRDQVDQIEAAVTRLAEHFGWDHTVIDTLMQGDCEPALKAAQKGEGEK